MKDKMKQKAMKIQVSYFKHQNANIYNTANSEDLVLDALYALSLLSKSINSNAFGKGKSAIKWFKTKNNNRVQSAIHKQFGPQPFLPQNSLEHPVREKLNEKATSVGCFSSDFCKLWTEKEAQYSQGASTSSESHTQKKFGNR